MAVIEFNNGLRRYVNKVYGIELRGDENSLLGFPISQEVKTLLDDIVELMMNTDFTKEDTKQYLKSSMDEYRRVYIIEGCSQNSSTTATRKRNDLNKLKRVLGEDFFDEVLYEKVGVERYHKKIKGLIEMQNRCLLDGFLLRYPKTNKSNTLLFDEDWECFLNLVKTYSKKAKQEAEKKITPQMIEYINYIEQNKNKLEGEEYSRYKQLEKILR